MQQLPTPDLVAALRSRRGLTQEEFAHELGVSFATVNAWERGRSEPRRTRRMELERLAQEIEAAAAPRLRALVIDDDPGGRAVAHGLIVGIDPTVEVEEASGGVEGLLMCGAHRPQLLFLDILMPDLDGFEVADRIRQIDGLDATTVVLMTSSDDPRLLARAERSAADHVLRKPLAESDVAHIVRRVFAHA